MIQIGTYIKVIDNSGARLVLCIRFLNGFKQRRANVGDVIVVVVKTLRLKRRAYIKVTKGAVLYALITQSKRGLKMFNGDQVKFLQCSVIILNKTKKLVGTRIFGILPKKFRYTRFMRVLALSSGCC